MAQDCLLVLPSTSRENLLGTAQTNSQLLATFWERRAVLSAHLALHFLPLCVRRSLS